MTTEIDWARLTSVLNDMRDEMETDEKHHFDARCECDLDYACFNIRCRYEHRLTEEHYGALYRKATPVPTREEWDDAYADNDGKRLAYDQMMGREGRHEEAH